MRRLIRACCFLVAWSMCHSGPARILAQEADSLAVKPDSAVTEAAHFFEFDSFKDSSLWRLPTDEIMAGMTEDIADAVRLLPNIAALDQGSLGQASPFSFRGTTAADGAVAFNGMVLREPLHGSVSSAALPVNLVKQVAFESRSGFGRYGEQTVGGQLLQRTLDLSQTQPYSLVQFRTGDWGYSDLGLAIGLPINKQARFMFSGSRQEYGGFRRQQDSVHSRFFNTIVFEPGNDLRLTSVTLLNKNDREIPGASSPDLVPELSNPRRKDRRFDQQVELQSRGFGQKSELRAKMFFSRERRKSFSDSLLFNNRTSSYGAAVEHNLDLAKHRISAGGQLRLDDLDSGQFSDASDGLVHFFLRDSFRLNAKLLLELQGRVEKHSDYSVQMTPSAHISYRLGSGLTTWIAGKRAVRYPTFAERFWQSLFYLGDPDLREETAISFESGFSIERSENLQVTSAFFIRQVDDWLGNETSGGVFGAQNFDRRTVSGVDLSANWQPAASTQLGLVGSYLYVRENQSALQLQVPEYSLYSFAQVRTRLFENSVGVTLRLIGRIYGVRYGWAYSGGATLPTFERRSADALLDGKLTLAFASANVVLSYENIFDRQTVNTDVLQRTYELVPGFSMPPRTFRVGIDWEFWD